MSPTEKIQQLLSHKPGLKAQQIATELGLERSQVVTTLHGPLESEVTQDNAYRWWPKTRGPHAAAGAPEPRTFLANLCRYYLECLSRESGSGHQHSGWRIPRRTLPWMICPSPRARATFSAPIVWRRRSCRRCGGREAS